MLNKPFFAKLGASALLLLSLAGCQDLLEQVFPKPTPPPTSPDNKPSVREEWVARYNSSGNGGDVAKGMVVDAVGNVYVTGTSSGPEGYMTVKYSPNGEQIWVARSAGSASNSNTPVVALDAAGNLIVARSANRGFLIIKYEAGTGQQLWAAQYEEQRKETTSYPTAVAVDRFGNVAVTGKVSTCCDVSNDAYLTVKYSAGGQQLWEARYDGASGQESPIAIAVDEAGNVIVTGSGASQRFSNFSIGTVKYAAATGQQLWAAKYRDGSNEGNTARALAVDAAGDVVVTGTRDEVVEGGKLLDIVTVRYSASGQQVWAARYNGAVQAVSRADYPTAVAFDAGGNVIITGVTGREIESNGTRGDYATVKYSTTGQQLWAATYDGPAKGQDVATALQLDPMGNVIVTGRSAGENSASDYATVKYSASGQQIWATRYDGPAQGQDDPVALAMDAAGDILVTGSSAGVGTGSDFATIKYTEKK